MQRRVRLLLPRHVDSTLVYQRYYALGFQELGVGAVSGGPLAARVFRSPSMRLLAALRLARGSSPGFVGRYVAELDGQKVRFAIDAHDARFVRDEGALAWSDVYFKANRWPGEEYPEKVRPIVNGNGVLDAARIEFLRSLRDAHRDVDVSFVARMHGGRPHTLAMFEALASLDCRADLLAILPPGFDDDAEYEGRLRELGVTVSRDELPPEELWRRLARAKVVVARSGRHLCISWRMIDLLALGACVVHDAPPLPEWPTPLAAGVHYEDGGIRRPLDGTAAPEEDYARFAAAVAALVADAGRAAALRAEAARYFDEHAAPRRVAEWVLGAL
jgi:hypothetical protein